MARDYAAVLTRSHTRPKRADAKDKAGKTKDEQRHTRPNVREAPLGGRETDKQTARPGEPGRAEVCSGGETRTLDAAGMNRVL